MEGWVLTLSQRVQKPAAWSAGSGQGGQRAGLSVLSPCRGAQRLGHRLAKQQGPLHCPSPASSWPPTSASVNKGRPRSLGIVSGKEKKTPGYSAMVTTYKGQDELALVCSPCPWEPLDRASSREKTQTHRHTRLRCSKPKPRVLHRKLSCRQLRWGGLRPGFALSGAVGDVDRGWDLLMFS